MPIFRTATASSATPRARLPSTRSAASLSSSIFLQHEEEPRAPPRSRGGKGPSGLPVPPLAGCGKRLNPCPQSRRVLRCPESPRSHVLPKDACARRFFARLASEIFLSSLPVEQAGLQAEFFSNLLGWPRPPEMNRQERDRSRRYPGNTSSLPQGAGAKRR